MGAWYTIGILAGLGAAFGILGAALVPRFVIAAVAGAVAGAVVGYFVFGWPEAIAGAVGGVLGSLGATPVVAGALRRGGTRGGTALLVGLAALVAAALAFVPVLGYLEAAVLPALGRRLRRRAAPRLRWPRPQVQWCACPAATRRMTLSSVGHVSVRYAASLRPCPARFSPARHERTRRGDHRGQTGHPDPDRRPDAADARGNRRAHASLSARERRLPPGRLHVSVADPGLPGVGRDRRPRRRARHPPPRLVEP